MTPIYTYKLARPCGNVRPFCRPCTNTFAIDQCGPTHCDASPPSQICMNVGVPGCTHPSVVVPKGFIVEIQQELDFHGPYRTVESAITSPAYTCGGSATLPGIPGIVPNIGCGYKVTTDIPFPNNPPISYSVTLLLGFNPTAVLYWFANGDQFPQTITDVYASDADFSTFDYMQVLTFRHFCGQSAGTTTTITAYPFR